MLPSWREGETRSAILAFLDRVDEIPPGDRVAVFDNDGTMWAEKPNYTQLEFILLHLGKAAAGNPTFGDRSEYRAILEGDVAELHRIGLEALGTALMDLFAGNFAHDDSRGRQPHSFFLRNMGKENDYIFQNMEQCGLGYQESYASPAAADYDNDGDLDLFFTTVYGTASFSKKNYPVLYRNDGSWKFIDVTENESVDKLAATYQAAWADFDNNGFLDLVSSGRVFMNAGNGNNWLKIKLTGDGKSVNTDAIGSQVRVKLKDKILTRQVEAGTGEGNQNEMTLHFGLGKYEKPVDIEVAWPNGSIRKINKIKPNQLLEVSFTVLP